LKPNIGVRQFQLDEMEHIVTIEKHSFAADAWDKKMFREYFRSCPDLFLVATLRRRIAGYVITCADSRSAELVSIAVDPRDRGRGAGKALLDETLAQLRARRIKTWWLTVETTNGSAIRFYEKYGFERTKLVKGYYSAKRDGWRMRLLV